MANVRDKIRLSAEEIPRYFDTQKTVIIATHNHDGYPHVVPMWFTMIDGLVHMHTYATSQKIRNVERDPRGAILIEDGEKYEELRGIYVRGRFEVRDDQDLCFRIAMANARKYLDVDPEQASDAIRQQIRKRVALIFHPEKSTSWDHRKI